MLHGLTVLQLLPQLGLLAVVRADRPTWLRALRGVGLAPLLTATLARTASEDVGDWVDPVSIKTINLFVKRFLSRWPLVCIGLVLVVLLGAAGTVVASRRAPSPVARARALVPVLWGLAPLVLLLLLSLARPSLVPRYAVASVPGLALLMAVAIERLGRARWWAAPVVRAAAAVVVAIALVAGHGLPAHPPDRRLDGRRPPGRRRAGAGRHHPHLARVDLPPAVRGGVAIRRAGRRTRCSSRPTGPSARSSASSPTRPRAPSAGTRPAPPGASGSSAIPAVSSSTGCPSLTVDGTAGRPASHREVARWRAPRSTIVVVLLEPV